MRTIASIAYSASKAIARRWAYRSKASSCSTKFSNSCLASVVPPAAPGSYGDQGMALGLINLLAANGIKNVRLVLTDPSEVNFKAFLQHHSAIPIDEVLVSCKADALLELGPQNLFIIGADVVDGSYGAKPALKRIELARQNLTLGGRSVFVSLSFSGQGPAEVDRAFSRLSEAEFFVRDSISYERFITNTGQKRGTLLTHDLAFLCPEESSKHIEDIHVAIREEHNNGKVAIGLNFSTVGIDHLRHDASAVSRSELVACICDEVIKANPNCFLVLISSDIRQWENFPSDATLVQIAAEYIKKRYPNLRYLCCPPTLEYPALVALTAELDFVIGGRMHLAIAALRASVPSIVIKYNEKLTGFYKDYFDLSDELAPSAMVHLASSIAYLSYNHRQLRDKLRDRVPRLLEKRCIGRAIYPGNCTDFSNVR